MRRVLVGIAGFGAHLLLALRAIMLPLLCPVINLRLDSHRYHCRGRGRLTTAGIMLALMGAATLAVPPAFAQNTVPWCDASSSLLTFWTREGKTVYFPPGGGVAWVCTDPDGPDPLTWALLSGPSWGALYLPPDLTPRYEPFPGFVGTDSFTLHAFDGADYSNPVTVTMNVCPTPYIPPDNQQPECPTTTVFIEEDGFVDFPIPPSPSPCSDPDNDPIGHGFSTGPTGGWLEVVGPPYALRYRPYPGTSSDGYVYTAQDVFCSSCSGTDYCEPNWQQAPILATTDILIIAAGTDTFSTASEATPANPYVALVTTTQPGAVSFEARTVTEPPPPGFVLLDQAFEITAPNALSASDPLQLVFTIDQSIVPASPVVVYRNGIAVEDCTGAPGLADPDPCVQEAILGADGDLQITVLSTAASRWTFGVPRAYDFSGFLRPVDNRPTLNLAKAGSAIPVKFSLRRDEGLEIFASGYPKSVAVDCDAVAEAEVDAIDTIATPGASDLSYDAAADQYTYVWKTLTDEWVNTCRVLVLRFNDPAESTQHANFKFR